MSIETWLRITAAGVLAVYWAVDRCRLQHSPPRSTIDQDKHSSLVWDAANVMQVIGVIVAFSSAGRIDGHARAQVMGLAVLLLGIRLRWRAMRTLGDLFAGRVVIQPGHRLIRVGPYAYLRHPAYAGSLVAHAGVGVALGNWWSLAASTVPYVAAVLYRIRVEEQALSRAFGAQYEEHTRSTARLIPWLY
jgi:protein-S-isoprenylcysteine O-methyltransferase